MKRNDQVKQDNGREPARTGTRDIVETAIDLSKSEKTESWDQMSRRVRVARWAAEKVQPK